MSRNLVSGGSQPENVSNGTVPVDTQLEVEKCDFLSFEFNFYLNSPLRTTVDWIIMKTIQPRGDFGGMHPEYSMKWR